MYLYNIYDSNKGQIVESDGTGWLHAILQYIATEIEMPNLWLLELKHVLADLGNAVGEENVLKLCVPVLRPVEVLTSETNQNLIAIVSKFYVMFKACQDWALTNSNLARFVDKCNERYTYIYKL